MTNSTSTPTLEELLEEALRRYRAWRVEHPQLSESEVLVLTDEERGHLDNFVCGVQGDIVVGLIMSRPEAFPMLFEHNEDFRIGVRDAIWNSCIGDAFYQRMDESDKEHARGQAVAS